MIEQIFNNNSTTSFSSNEEPPSGKETKGYRQLAKINTPGEKVETAPPPPRKREELLNSIGTIGYGFEHSAMRLRSSTHYIRNASYSHTSHPLVRLRGKSNGLVVTTYLSYPGHHTRPRERANNGCLKARSGRPRRRKWKYQWKARTKAMSQRVRPKCAR